MTRYLSHRTLLSQICAVVVTTAILAASPVPAQDTEVVAAQDEPVQKQIDPVVQTATKVETPVSHVPSAVTVIPGEEILRLRYTNVGDVLRNVPAVQIQSSGGLGKLTNARIRGAGPSQIQVLIDGARVDSPTAGAFDFSDISPDLIDRIEIVRGPQSTLYGADAIGGVINIITKRGADPFSGTLSVEGGNYDYYRGRAAFGGTWKLLDYAGFGSLFGFSGPGDNNDSNQRAFGGQVGVSLPLNGRLSLSGRYAKSSTDVPIDTAIPPVLDPDSQQQSEFSTLTLQLVQTPVRWWEYRLALHGMWNNVGFQDGPQPGPFAGSLRSQIDTRRGEVDFVNALRFVDWNTLTLGAEHRQEEGRIDSTFSFDTFVDHTRLERTLKNTSFFAQDELTILNRVVLSGGIRYDINEPFDNALTGRAGAVVLINETSTRVRGGWGQGFRAPTINDLYFPGAGNPNLQPERSESWEVGVDQRFWQNRLRLGATYFDTRFTDLIQFDLLLFQPVNIGRARARGVELVAEMDVLDWLTVNVNYTYTDAKDLNTGEPLLRFARQVLNLGVIAEPIRRLSAWVQLYAVSSQPEAPGVTNPGYVRVDLGASYLFLERRARWPALTAYTRIQNALNRQYDEVLGFPAPGITALVGLQASY